MRGCQPVDKAGSGSIILLVHHFKNNYQIRTSEESPKQNRIISCSTCHRYFPILLCQSVLACSQVRSRSICIVVRVLLRCGGLSCLAESHIQAACIDTATLPGLTSIDEHASKAFPLHLHLISDCLSLLL